MSTTEFISADIGMRITQKHDQFHLKTAVEGKVFTEPDLATSWF